MKKKTTAIAAVLASALMLTGCSGPKGYVSEIEDTDEWEKIKLLFADEYDEDGSEEEIWVDILEYVAEEEDEEVLKMSGEEYWDFLVDYYEDCLEDYVSDMDVTAARIRNNTTSFLTMLNSKSIVMTNSGDFTICVSIDKDGVLHISGGAGAADFQDGVDHWGTESTKDVLNKRTELVDFMKDMLGNLENTYAEVHFSGGKCVGAIAVAFTDSRPDVQLPTMQEFMFFNVSDAFADQEGVSEGYVVGTAPKLDGVH